MHFIPFCALFFSNVFVCVCVCVCARPRRKLHYVFLFNDGIFIVYFSVYRYNRNFLQIDLSISVIAFHCSFLLIYY